MEFVNLPSESFPNVIHETFYSQLYRHEIGYTIYLPPDYENNHQNYPVAYHLHGWTGHESSETWMLEKVYKDQQAIIVFPNNSPVIEDFEDLPVEAMIVNECIPHIDCKYRTDPARESRSISGFSMGGGMAFYWAVKHSDLFSSVTAYAGTYHHYFHKGSRTVGEPSEKAAKLYQEMIREKRDFEEGNILCLVRQNADKIRGNLNIQMHIGTEDVLICDNEIVHFYLDSLDIPHRYTKFAGAAHELDKIL